MTNKRVTYGDARWILGLSSIVFWIGVCVLGIIFDAGVIFENCAHEVGVIFGTFWGCYILLGFPLDFIGGYLLPRKYSRSSSTFLNWFSKWCRGSILHGAYMWLGSMALIRVAEHLGLWGSIAFVGVHMLLMTRFQLFLAQLIAPLRSLSSARLKFDSGALSRLRIHTVESEDEAFTGGVTGHPGRERIILPAHWKDQVPGEIMGALKVRRLATVLSGSRTRGLLAALIWNLVWFAIAVGLTPYSLNSVSGILTTVFWFSLFCCLGHIGLLPFLSRKGSVEVDGWTHTKGACEFKMQKGISYTNKLQGDRPCRSLWIEKIFSGTPSVEIRLQHLFSGKYSKGAWNASYMMLFLSWAGLGLVSRAAPCNLGRPELWVLLPCD